MVTLFPNTLFLILPLPQTSNSELIFRLSRQTNNPFHLDQNTGVLSVLNSLDHETQSNYVVGHSLPLLPMSSGMLTFLHLSLPPNPLHPCPTLLTPHPSPTLPNPYTPNPPTLPTPLPHPPPPS